MTGVGFFLREALRSMRRNAAPSFAAIATVLVTMLVLGIFIPIVQATTGAANNVRKRVLVNVYLKAAAGPSDITRVRGLLLRSGHVRSVQFVSKQAAYDQQRKLHPDLYALLGANPLPDTFHVIPDDPDNALRIRSELARPGRPRFADPAIANVSNRRDDTRRILTVTRVVKLTTGLLTLVLGSASILLIANTIRLSLFARRREVEVMKLVGATDWFIRWPFVIEGMLVGAIGSALAVTLLAVGKITLLDPLTSHLTLIAAPSTIALPLLVLVIFLAGMGVSAAGSGLSLRRFLRV